MSTVNCDLLRGCDVAQIRLLLLQHCSQASGWLPAGHFMCKASLKTTIHIRSTFLRFFLWSCAAAQCLITTRFLPKPHVLEVPETLSHRPFQDRKHKNTTALKWCGLLKALILNTKKPILLSACYGTLNNNTAKSKGGNITLNTFFGKQFCVNWF